MKIIPLIISPPLALVVAAGGIPPLSATSDPLSITTPAPVYHDSHNVEFLARYPGVENAEGNDLDKRQQGVQTCALINGNLAYPLWCPPGVTCVFDTVESLAGCCVSGGACPQMTSCLPYSSSAYCSANAACQRDARLIKCFNPLVPDCVTVSMYSAGTTLRHYDCGTLGAAGIYYASWFRPSSTPVFSTPGPGPSPSPGPEAVPGLKGGGDNNQAVGGNGGNVNGNGNTVIYRNGVGRQITSIGLKWSMVGMVMVLL